MIAGCGSNTPQQNLDLPDILSWIGPDADIVSVLSTEANECISPPSHSQEMQNLVLGRLAFSSPFLLGGQATRQNLSCQACHTQGSRNQHFFIHGMSDKAGTADISNFHFSKSLGDTVFNPVDIPSLSDAIRNIDYDRSKNDLETFIDHLITEEFTGNTPSPEIKTALLFYLRSLDDNICAQEQLPQYLQGAALLDYKIATLSKAFTTLEQNRFTQETQNFMATALRLELGRLSRRFPDSQTMQTQFIAISQNLNARGQDISQEQLIKAAHLWQKLTPSLDKAYAQSLYHPENIEKWVKTFDRQH